MNPALAILQAVEWPWGDYGLLLAHGMTTYKERLNGKLRLQRIGPSIYPITFPSDIVVTDAFKKKLELSGLSGFAFVPVIKDHIVELNWEDWDCSAEDPEVHPPDGEPESYILKRPHSERAAAGLGLLWELAISADGVDVARHGTKVLALKPETWSGTDFFTARTTRLPCVSPKAQAWLTKNYADYVRFSERP